MTFKSCRTWLAGIWLLGSVLLFIVMILRSSDPANPADVTTAMWKWLLPNVMPFVTLVVTAVVVIAQDGAAVTARTDRVGGLSFIVAAGASIVYIAALSLMLFSKALLVAKAPAEFLGSTSIWVTPVQGVVSAALGVFFVKPRRR